MRTEAEADAQNFKKKPLCRSDYLYSALEELAATEGSSLYATDEQLIAYAAKQGYMTADHILLLTRDMSTYQELDDETKAEKKALAEELKAKLDAYTGDDLIGYFTELADEYSEDSGRAGNPEGYTFGSGQMVEEFESAAAALGEGEVARSWRATTATTSFSASRSMRRRLWTRCARPISVICSRAASRTPRWR